MSAIELVEGKMYLMLWRGEWHIMEYAQKKLFYAERTHGCVDLDWLADDDEIIPIDLATRAPQLEAENARLREVLEMASNTIQTTIHFMPEVGNGAHLKTLEAINKVLKSSE